jgi:hypothetical protein
MTDATTFRTCHRKSSVAEASALTIQRASRPADASARTAYCASRSAETGARTAQRRSLDDDTELATRQRVSRLDETVVVASSESRIASIGPHELDAKVKEKVGALVLDPVRTLVFQVITAPCRPDELPNREPFWTALKVSPVCVTVSPEAVEDASVSEE